ncbi:MAG: DUF6671 family protein [Geminicoccaceae bacterium]
MTSPSTPYRGASVALGSMHGKERAIAAPLRRALGASLIVPSGIDTDAYGTFTGEVERYGTMLEAARAKARLAMAATGLPLGIASEGSYGPHPYLPLVAGGTELVLFIDDIRGLEIREALVVKRTNFDSQVCAPGDDIEGFLTRARFPTHALVVQPHVPIESRNLIEAALSAAPQTLLTPATARHPVLFKGVRDRSHLLQAIETAATLSFDGKARLVTDMRAHLNPTRMAMIRTAATRLARRIACLCPACATPGFGLVDVARGLPCADCGEPTSRLIAEIHRCSVCSFDRQVPLRHAPQTADPSYCDRCNP